MKRKALIFRSRFFSEETGMALVIVLVLLVLGSLTMLPVLAHLATAFKTGQMYEEKTNALYTADAGIEDALWRLKYDSMGPEYSEFDFDTTWDYETDILNDMTATATIKNVWIPTNVTLDELGLDTEAAEAMIEAEKLVVTGTSGAIPGEPYNIKIDFTPDTGDNLTVKSIGVWLPQGFEFVPTENTLEEGTGQPYYPYSVSISICPGGSATVWSYQEGNYPEFASFPGVDPDAIPMTTEIEFNYTAPPENPDYLPAAIAWITTDMIGGTNDVPISWDMDTRIFQITSTAGGTEIEAYSSKCELRQMGDAMAGDYVAIGSSLMTNVIYNKRYTLLSESSHDLTSIPEDADVISAYLYWSGWKNDSTVTDIFSDSCSDFDDWSRSNDVDYQTRVPTGDGDTSGTWNTAPCWDDVDETSANDTDYMTGTSSSSYKLFTFSPFSIPGGSSIGELTIHVRAKDASYGTNNIRPSIKVNGTRYNYEIGGSNPGTSWTTYSYSYSTNPATGAAWEVDDINGTGSNPLEQFGVYSSDLSPDIDVSMVYAEVSMGCWSIYNNDDFRGQGAGSATAAQRTLTLTDGIDLSSYDPGTVVVDWLQSESGTLEEDDALYLAISSDNGTSWSDNIEVFSDDNPNDFYWYHIPEDYLTSGFKMRLYLDFDSSTESVNLDSIRVSYLQPDIEATFKIDGTQVYLDGGVPTEGSGDLIASNWQVMPSPFSGTFDGFSYACSKDVSKLVKAFPENPGEEHHTGNAIYTLGDVDGSTEHHLSYAGWSLIIVYASPQTAGHYLYLSDTFAFHPGTGGNLDFDFDGEDGGDITNFVIPEPIKDQYGNIIEEVAAKITCFIGEGDEVWSPEYVQITGQQSANSMYLSNAVSPWNNIWNGESPGMTYAGVDIDTFEVLWTDQIFQPDDTSVHLDMVSNQDAWNFIYFIISVRSETITGGTSHYVIYSG